MIFLLACRCGAPEDTAAEVRTREPCADYSVDKRVFWGDTHIHTALSFDAWAYDVRATPADAWRFAQGDEVDLGFDTRGLDRPLDFAAITDHAEYLAEIPGCTTPGSEAYDTETCTNYRESSTSRAVQLFGVKMSMEDPDRFEDICSVLDCELEARETWQQVQDAAEEAYDRTSECAFTSFVAYEWSGTPNVANLHRNVIFANWKVPEQATTYFEVQSGPDLWDALERDCLEGRPGCDVLAIPHNGNTSNGTLFAFDGNADDAARRARFEPLVEIYQHKGDSECREGFFGADELCTFEKVRLDDEVENCGEGTGTAGLTYAGCQADRDFLRGMLALGIELEDSLGANPFRSGVLAATDTHSATPGLVDEATFQGHLGSAEDEPEERLASPRLNPGGVINSGGGLMGVWAEENSREALFAAMQRREVYGTSGPRIEVRVTAGDGTPMGGITTDPSFTLSAVADEVPLERVQIVRGWLEDGEARIEVLDVAGEAVDEPDLETCAVAEGGHDRLDVTWVDEAYEGGPAFWYVRVLEVPTCRWSWRDCLSYGDEERPENCEDAAIPRTVRERAWTSPIWAG